MVNEGNKDFRRMDSSVVTMAPPFKNPPLGCIHEGNLNSGVARSKNTQEPRKPGKEKIRIQRVGQYV